MRFNVEKIDRKTYSGSFAYWVLANIFIAYGTILKDKVDFTISGLLSYSSSDSLSHYVLNGLSISFTIFSFIVYALIILVPIVLIASNQHRDHLSMLVAFVCTVISVQYQIYYFPTFAFSNISGIFLLCVSAIPYSNWNQYKIVNIR